MPKTKRGVYHNLKESKYVVSNKDITFFFSSEYTLNKFIDGYQDYRTLFYKKLATDSMLNFDTLADIEWYRKTEKRGFYAWLKGVSITWKELNQYAVRKMIDDTSPEWEKINRPNITERFRIME